MIEAESITTNTTPTTTEPTPTPTFTRTPMGVITQYEIFAYNHAYLVELWRGTVSRCTCGLNSTVSTCQHGKLALLLEERYQEEHKQEEPASCVYCGRDCREVNGVAVCPRCSW